MNTGSLVTAIPRDKENERVKKTLSITRKYPDVNKIEVNFAAKITVEAESRWLRKKMAMIINEWEDIKPLHVWIDYENLFGRYKALKVRETTTQSEDKQNNRKLRKTIQNEPNDKKHRG